MPEEIAAVFIQYLQLPKNFLEPSDKKRDKNKKSPENNNLNMTQLKYDTNQMTEQCRKMQSP